MSEDAEEIHGPSEVGWDNLRKENVMFCGKDGCHFVARGDTWGEAGDEMDQHIEEMNR